MRRWFLYCILQVKRMGKQLPAVMSAILITCLCLGVCTFVYIKNSAFEEKQRKYQIGLVGNISDSYLGFGIYALQSLDDSRLLVDFIPMGEEEARTRFQRGELAAYVRIPDGLVDSLVSGENDRTITYVCAEGQKGIGSIVVEELADIASSLVTHSQSAVYGTQNVIIDTGNSDILWQATDQINLRLIDIVLNRTKLCQLEILGISDGLSWEGYYLCALTVFFFLIIGIYGWPLFICGNSALPRLMKAKGMGAASQILGEYLPYLCMNVLCSAGLFLAMKIALGNGIVTVSEWRGLEMEFLAVFCRLMFPVVAMLSAMQFLLYELTSGIVSSLLLQFTSGIAMGYLAGCFYPTAFFPKTLRALGEVLPVGAAMRYALQCMQGEFPVAEGMAVLFYLLLFLGASAVVRSIRIRRG